MRRPCVQRRHGALVRYRDVGAGRSLVVDGVAGKLGVSRAGPRSGLC